MAQYRENNHAAFISTATMARYLRVKLNSSGKILLAGASDREIGVTTRPVNDTVNPYDVLLSSANGTFECQATGAVNIGDPIYGAPAGQVNNTGVPGACLIGIALSAAVNANDVIEVLRLETSPGKLYSATSTTDTVTNTITETAFAQSTTLPANFLQVGDVIRIRAGLTVTSHNSTDTLNVKLYVGSNVIASTGAIDNAANDTVWIDAEVVVRTITSSGTIVAMGLVVDGTPGTATAKQFTFASATLDSTVAEIIKLTATWSVASASDIVRLDILDINRVPAN